MSLSYEQRGLLVDLECAIERDLDAVEPYLAYADRLLEFSDPRGELIKVQCEMEHASGDELKKLKNRSKWLIKKHGWLDCFEEASGRHSVQWRRGFWQEAKIELFCRYQRFDTQLQMLQRALASGSARFMRELTIQSYYPQSEGNLAEVLKVVAGAGRPPLRKLVMDFVSLPKSLSAIAQMPHLHEISLPGINDHLGRSLTAALHGRRLARLEADLSDLAPETRAALLGVVDEVSAPKRRR